MLDEGDSRQVGDTLVRELFQARRDCRDPTRRDLRHDNVISRTLIHPDRKHISGLWNKTSPPFNDCGFVSQGIRLCNLPDSSAVDILALEIPLLRHTFPRDMAASRERLGTDDPDDGNDRVDVKSIGSISSLRSRFEASSSSASGSARPVKTVPTKQQDITGGSSNSAILDGKAVTPKPSPSVSRPRTPELKMASPMNPPRITQQPPSPEANVTRVESTEGPSTFAATALTTAAGASPEGGLNASTTTSAQEETRPARPPASRISYSNSKQFNYHQSDCCDSHPCRWICTRIESWSWSWSGCF
jgi:hypothetical protein